jgi:YVTN family beta-propeller protein
MLVLGTVVVAHGRPDPAHAAAPADPTVYVANGNSHDVTPIDVATNTAGAPIPVGLAPEGVQAVAITPDGTTAYVANATSDTVTPIDLTTNTPGTPIPIGDSPQGVAITPDGTTAYVVTTSDHSVTPIDLSTNMPGTAIVVGNFPVGVAITPDGTTAYVTRTSANAVTPIDVETNMAGTAIPLGGISPRGVAITPDGMTAYVANFASHTVTPIDLTAATAGTPIAVGTNPHTVAITPDGMTAYVPDLGADTVTPIDVTTNTALTPIPVGDAPAGVAITPDGATAYVTNRDSDTVTPIDVVTNMAATPIAVGDGPVAVAINPAVPPDAPSYVAAVRGDGEATVWWGAPLSDGGLPITGYTVTSDPDGAMCGWTMGTLECAVPGLTNGTPYTFTVTATNSVGTGPASDPSNPVTPSVTPHRVPRPDWGENPPATPKGLEQLQGVFVTAGDQQATVTFSTATPEGEGATVTYRVTASPGDAAATGASSPITVTGLRNDVRYTFLVEAVATSGAVLASAPSETVVPGSAGSRATPERREPECDDGARLALAEHAAPAVPREALIALLLPVSILHRRRSRASSDPGPGTRAASARRRIAIVAVGVATVVAIGVLSRTSDLPLC